MCGSENNLLWNLCSSLTHGWKTLKSLLQFQIYSFEFWTLGNLNTCSPEIFLHFSLLHLKKKTPWTMCPWSIIWGVKWLEFLIVFKYFLVSKNHQMCIFKMKKRKKKKLECTCAWKSKYVTWTPNLLNPNNKKLVQYSVCHFLSMY